MPPESLTTHQAFESRCHSNTDFDPTSLEVTVDGATSLLRGVEEIHFTGNGGSDTLTVSGNLNGTGLSQSTIHFDAGDADDTVDVSARTSPHRVLADGGAAPIPPFSASASTMPA